MKTKVTTKLRNIEAAMLRMKGIMKDKVNEFILDESGMGTVEIILIIVVLIGLVIVFKQQIDGLVEKIFKVIKNDTQAIIGM